VKSVFDIMGGAAVCSAWLRDTFADVTDLP